MSFIKIVTGVLLSTAFMTGSAFADAGHKKGHDPVEIGQPGKATQVFRTIVVEMTDNAFSLNAINVKKGETVRFKLINKGGSWHEFSIGTGSMHAGHLNVLLKMMDAGHLDDNGLPTAKDHNDANTVTLAPGQSGELIWQFTKSGTLEAACNLPGHYESGMFARLAVLR
jgi:uncharacterized cupredoxin-like copper-binding protein